MPERVGFVEVSVGIFDCVSLEVPEEFATEVALGVAPGGRSSCP
jgi:hypothetical protein